MSPPKVTARVFMTGPESALNATVYLSDGRTLGFALESTDFFKAQHEVLDRIGRHHFADWSWSGALVGKRCMFGRIEKVDCSDHPKWLTLVDLMKIGNTVEAQLCTEHLETWAKPKGWALAGRDSATTAN